MADTMETKITVEGEGLEKEVVWYRNKMGLSVSLSEFVEIAERNFHMFFLEIWW